MMKVIHYYDRFKPLLGGVETHIENLVKISDIEFEILTNAIPHVPLCEKFTENAFIRRIGPNDRTIAPFRNTNVSKGTFLYRLMTDFVRNKRKINFLKQMDYDILHVHGPALSMNLQRMDRWLKRPFLTKKMNFSSIEKPKVLTMHGLFSTFTSNPFAEKHERRLIAMFENVICVDEFILDKVRSYGREDAVIIPNGIDMTVFRYTQPNPGKKTKLGFVGRIEDEISGLQLLRELAKKNLPWLEISIVGAGTRQAIQRFKAGINMRNIELIPNLEPEKIPDYLSDIDILFNPIMTGAITRVTLEAMACGRPVIMIGEDQKGPIIDHETGYLVEDDVESLLKLLGELHKNKEYLIKTGKNTRSIIESKYSNDVILPRIAKLYDDLT